LRIWLDIDERIGRGELAPGAYRKGTFEWRHDCGRTDKVSYEADMTDPAGGWLRLWFFNNAPKTGKLQVNDQCVRMVAAPDGHWHFIVGQQASPRLYLRPGGKRFKCPAAARTRRKQRKRWLMWAGSVTRNHAPARLALHIDDFLHNAVLVPGELRNSKFELHNGDRTLSIRYSSAQTLCFYGARQDERKCGVFLCAQAGYHGLRPQHPTGSRQVI
jgi:hypothetical protein